MMILLWLQNMNARGSMGHNQQMGRRQAHIFGDEEDIWGDDPEPDGNDDDDNIFLFECL